MPGFKKSALSIVCLFTALSSFAQDKLYKQNGDMLQVKITEVSDRTIRYKRSDNLEGPVYSINRNEVSKIQYENGSIEYYNSNGRHARPGSRMMAEENGNGSHKNRPSYGNNILSFAPVQFTNTSVTGLGLHYERILDRRGIFSLYIPVVFSFKNDDYNNYNYPYNNQNNDRYNMFWTYPGLKIYPTGSNRKVSYAVGPSLAIGAGSRPTYQNMYDPNTGSYLGTTRTMTDIFQMGIMVNNSLNIQPTPRLYLGVEFGLGIPYIQNKTYDQYGNRVDNYNDEPLVQFNFKVGYRF